MTKSKKHYLEKKIEGIDQKYSRIPDQYSELKNIYRGKDAKGKKANKLHKLKDRYEAAEKYLQEQDKKGLTPEQRKYLIDLARTFVEYDLKLDKKRKENSEYKTSVRAKRIDHLGKTLEYIAMDEAPAQTQPSKPYKTLDQYVQTPRIVMPTPQPSPSVTPNTTKVVPGPSLVSRMYQSTHNAYTKTKGAVKKHWKLGVAIAAGVATACLLYYCANNKPVVKPPKQTPKIEYVKPQKNPEVPPIIKKQTPPIIKKEQPPVIKKEQPKYEPPVVKEQPKVEQILSEKDWTGKFKKGEIDLNKYDVFFSGMWYEPGAIVLHEKGSDKIRFDTAMSGDLMWEDVETKKELGDLVNMMEKNNMFGSGRIALRAEYVKNKAGEILGIIFTDSLNKRIVNLKDGKVMVYSINHPGLNGGGDSGSGSGSGSGGSGGGGSM